MTARLLAATVFALAACVPPASQQQAAAPHYLVGAPYRLGPVWRYPREQFDYDATGLAMVDPRTTGLTADGEAIDPQAMAAAHPTLQLPAIARVTELDTGYQVLVRINDRGPANPGRIIALSPRAMALLHAPDPSAARVRVEVMQAESLRLAGELGGAESPHLELAVVPVGDVTKQALPPPAGIPAAPARDLPTAPAPHSSSAATPPVPLRLPETVTRVPPHPGSIYVEIASFGRAEYAALLQQRLAALGAEVTLDYDAPRDRDYRVRIGPLAGGTGADAMLARVIAAGFGDARIVAQ